MAIIARRDFMLTGMAFAGLAALAGCSREEPTTRGNSEGFDALAALIVVLFPHKNINPSVYEEVAELVRAQLSAREDWARLQQEGRAALNAAAGAPWESLEMGARVKAAEVISKTRFFKTVYQAALFEFYSHPAVWALVGYPGSSAEQGGYLHRGFDDIDWLPEAAP